MANSDGILEVSHASEKIKNIVIKSDNLVEYIKSDIANAKKSDFVSQKQMKAYSDSFLMMTIENKVDYRTEYIEKFGIFESIAHDNIEETFQNGENNKEELRNKLIEFRKNKSKERRIPAYYIFNIKNWKIF